ncbi:MAG: phosphonoacetaldehyde reductase [Rhizobiales bacterium]|nr:phosphonoacetaldehyde reductase [Hyphomicrobiales bacterium]
MKSRQHPPPIRFGGGRVTWRFACLPQLIGGRPYALVTYGEPFFDDLTARLSHMAGAPTLIVNDVAPNPDCRLLTAQCRRFAEASSRAEVIVALGGGSVIDSAKVFAAAGGDFTWVRRFLETKDGADALTATPIIAVPTTAGTGSEVTCWATVWDEANEKKYSLARPSLYPEAALIDPLLMCGKPRALTISTGLDALSHALESLWNVNANPVSANHAVAAARRIIDTMPKLAGDLDNVALRSDMAIASLSAGLAFSNTKTAIAHSLSYPLTLRHNLPHGIACSFSLPMILRSMRGADGLCGEALARIFGGDIDRGAAELGNLLHTLGVSTDPKCYGVGVDEWHVLIAEALMGERGQNFLGSKNALLKSALPQAA